MNTIYRSNIYSAFFLVVYILGSSLLSILYTSIGFVPPYWLRSCLLYLLLFGLPAIWFMHRCGMSAATIRLVHGRSAGYGAGAARARASAGSAQMRSAADSSQARSAADSAQLRSSADSAQLRSSASSSRAVLFTVLIAFLIQAPLMLLSSLSELIFHNYTADSMSTLLAQPLPLVLLSTAVCPAVFEELACRGIFLSGYRRTHPLIAALLCGVFFGIIHLNMQQWVYAFFFGFVISLLCLATDSLWLPMLAHFLINATQLICAYYGIALFPNLPVTAIATIISLPLIYWMLRTLWKDSIASASNTTANSAAPQVAGALQPQCWEPLAVDAVQPHSWEPLKLADMKPFFITVAVFVASLFMLQA